MGSNMTSSFEPTAKATHVEWRSSNTSIPLISMIPLIPPPNKNGKAVKVNSTKSRIIFQNRYSWRKQSRLLSTLTSASSARVPVVRAKATCHVGDTACLMVKTYIVFVLQTVIGVEKNQKIKKSKKTTAATTFAQYVRFFWFFETV